jgi:hypothetical protein
MHKISFITLIAALVCATAASAAYTPKMPKMAATTAIVTVDLATDLAARSWEAKEDYIAITAIQGIVNRTSATKIYLLHTCTEINWCVETDQMKLDDSMFPVPRTAAVLPGGKKYPALSYLLQQYSSYIKGKVLYPSLPPSCEGAVTAAITACGMEDAIPVSSAIDAYISGEGYSFAQKADTRTLTNNVAACDWAWANYYNTTTTKAFIGWHSFSVFGGTVNNQFPTYFDYFIACRAFCASLNANNASELTRINSLLPNWPEGTPVMGIPTDESKGLSAMESQSKYFMISYCPNMSVSSSFPSDATKFRQPKIPTADTVLNNGAYVGFYITDGDSYRFSVHHHYSSWRSADGAIPVAWSTNPHLLDLFPTLIEWYSKHNFNDAYELVADPHDQCGTSILADGAAFGAAMKNYMENSNGVFRTFNAFNYDGKANILIPKINPYFMIRGYQGTTNGNAVTWYTLSNNTITAVNLSGGTQYRATLSEMVSAVKFVVDATAANTPAFVIICGDDMGNLADIKTVCNQLQSNSNGRTYRFLRPQDIAATWRKWKGYDVVASTVDSKKVPGMVDRSAASCKISLGEGFDVNAKNNGVFVCDLSGRAFYPGRAAGSKVRIETHKPVAAEK